MGWTVQGGQTGSRASTAAEQIRRHPPPSSPRNTAEAPRASGCGPSTRSSPGDPAWPCLGDPRSGNIEAGWTAGQAEAPHAGSRETANRPHGFLPFYWGAALARGVHPGSRGPVACRPAQVRVSLRLLGPLLFFSPPMVSNPLPPPPNGIASPMSESRRLRLRKAGSG